MSKKRIDGALASIPVQNGQTLKGEHLAILREVLVAGINENKYDLDRIVTGKSNAIQVYGDSVDALDSYAAENEVTTNSLGYLYTPECIELYKYNGDSWDYIMELSLTSLLELILNG
jgi:hypothetical protein